MGLGIANGKPYVVSLAVPAEQGFSPLNHPGRFIIDPFGAYQAQAGQDAADFAQSDGTRLAARGIDFFASACGQQIIMPSERVLPDPSHKPYLAPNELQPVVAEQIWERSNGGVYISLGTERGFIGAAKAQSSHLLLIDYDKSVLRFNQFNILLLKASACRTHYLRLRLAGAKSDFEQELDHSQLDSISKEWLLSNWEWWQKNVVSSEGGGVGDFAHLHSKHSVYFSRCNYLYDDELFSHLKKLADLDRMQVYGIDLRDMQQVKEMIAKLGNGVQKGQYKIGVIDLSNAWMSVTGSYLFKKGVSLIAREASDQGIAAPDTILLMTRGATTKGSVWEYFGFDFEFLGPQISNSFIDNSLTSIIKHRDFLKEMEGLLRRHSIITPRERMVEFGVAVFNESPGVVTISDDSKARFLFAMNRSVRFDDVNAAEKLHRFGMETGFLGKAGGRFLPLTTFSNH